MASCACDTRARARASKNGAPPAGLSCAARPTRRPALRRAILARRSYAIGAVLALVAIGGNGVLYQIDIKPAPVSSDQMREAAEIPGGPAQNQVRPPTFGTSAGTSKPRQ